MFGTAAFLELLRMKAVTKTTNSLMRIGTEEKRG